MAIVRMKRLHLLAPYNVRRRLLRELTRIGCVEVERADEKLSSPEWAEILHKQEESTPTAAMLSEAAAAMEALKTYAGVKKGILTPRQEVKEAQLYDAETIQSAVDVAKEINTYAKAIATLHAEESKQQGLKGSLVPWASTNVPLNYQSKGTFLVLFGLCPASMDVAAVTSALSEAVPASHLSLVSSDKEQHYLLLICHADAEDAAMDVLKNYGFARANFKGLTGTATENIAALDREIAGIVAKREAEVSKIVARASSYEAIGLAVDALTLESQRDDLLNALGTTQKTVYLEGWVPEYNEAAVATIAEKLECAYAFTQPEEDEEPPVLLNNSKLVQPFGAITELYGLPEYKSIVDPNPFVALSYFVFFGLMFSDAAYGVILTIASLFVLKKAKPSGTFRKFMQLALFVGISTTLWGAAFGSWFGNMIPVVSEMITGTAVNVPMIMDPLSDPMTMLIVSLAFGVIHLFVGMGLSAYRMIRRGQWFDAICDVFVWYLIIGGLLAFLLGIQIGLWLAVVGAVWVLFTAGRAKKGIFGKITGGLSGLYGSTSYLSDILSYSRLMALSLATGVIAQVVNTLGSMFGNGFFGLLMFAVIFVIGQVFNFAINILGAFVHSCRLEYVEFFGKFYEAGGRAFNPLFYKTKYVNVVKEEN